MKKLLFVIYILLFIFSIHAQENPLEALYVIDNEYTFQVTFGFNYLYISENSTFGIRMYKNDKLTQENLCFQTFNDISGIYGKITCTIEKKGDGQYIFEGTIFHNGMENYTEGIQSTVLGTITSSFTFEEVRDGTKILLNIGGTGEKIQVLSRIPKEVIEILTPLNKNNFINSELEYEIIEEDPLIAWNVEKIPTTIEYTIKKNISKEERRNFAMEIRNSEETHVITYIIFFLILIILLYVFKPLFNKKK